MSQETEISTPQDVEIETAERVYRRGEDSAILRLSESQVQSYRPEDDRRMVINMGPQHPSTHGVLRLSLEMEGETVLRSKPIIGYLHTGMEKTGEQLSFLQGPTNVTRMDYSSPLFSELAFSLATEKLLDLEIPERATWIRMLMCELNRMSSHLLFQATNGMDIRSMRFFPLESFCTSRPRLLAASAREAGSPYAIASDWVQRH